MFGNVNYPSVKTQEHKTCSNGSIRNTPVNHTVQSTQKTHATDTARGMAANPITWTHGMPTRARLAQLALFLETLRS